MKDRWAEIADQEFEAKWSDHPAPEGEIVYRETKDYYRFRPFEQLAKFSYEAYLNTNHWAITRRRALIRAGHQCKGCETTKWLDVHHKTYERLWREKEEDLLVLCRWCHTFVHRLPEFGCTEDQIRVLVYDRPHLIGTLRRMAPPA